MIKMLEKDIRHNPFFKTKSFIINPGCFPGFFIAFIFFENKSNKKSYPIHKIIFMFFLPNCLVKISLSS